jgi:hypothetical protein
MLHATLLATLLSTSGLPGAVPGHALLARAPVVLRLVTAQTDPKRDIAKVEAAWRWLVRARNWYDVRSWTYQCYDAYRERKHPKLAARVCALRAMKALWPLPKRARELTGKMYLSSLVERKQLPGKVRGLYLANLLAGVYGHAQVVGRLLASLKNPTDTLSDPVALYLQQRKTFAGCRHKALLIARIYPDSSYGRSAIMSARNATNLVARYKCRGGEAALLKLLKHPDASLRLAACRAVAALRYRPARAELKRLAKYDRYFHIVDCPPRTRCQIWPVRKAAAAALKAL